VHERYKKCLFLKEYEGKDHVEYLGVAGSVDIIFKWFLKMYALRMLSGLKWL
jgi:hypothetical protein